MLLSALHAAGELELFLVLNGHEAEQDMRHTEIAETPRERGDYVQKIIGLTLAGIFYI